MAAGHAPGWSRGKKTASAIGLVVILVAAGWAIHRSGLLRPAAPSDVEEPIRGFDFDVDRSAIEIPLPVRCPAGAPGAGGPGGEIVVRGCVFERGGGALEGVRVSLLSAPASAATTSVNGTFALSVAADPALRLKFEKAGFLEAYRTVDAEDPMGVWIEDVALVPLDSASAPIDFSSPMSVARGSAVSDESGSRQATLLFRNTTSASIVRGDGSRVPAASLTVRATEFTVGEDGPLAMPAELPETSAYTYAIALTVDEAQAMGARSVEFSEPVYQYVENFLGFPVGTPVPLGFYDPAAGEWKPEPNGRVISVLRIEDGLALVDVDGTGTWNETAAEALRISETERRELARLYAPGTTLWRVGLTHFSTFDLNWPWRADGTEPEPFGGPPACEPCTQGGHSRIELVTQALIEDVPAAERLGGLHYSSERTQAHTASYRVTLPLGQIPPNVLRVEVEVFVAGQRIEKAFEPRSGTEWTFEWDGKDANGEPVDGPVPIRIDRGYAYKARYAAPGERAFSFLEQGRDFGWNATRKEITLKSTWEGSIGAWDARAMGLGGLTLGEVHRYDPESQTLMMGDGTRRHAASHELALRTLPLRLFDAAPNETAFGTMTIAVGPDGRLVVSHGDFVAQRIFEMQPGGQLHHIAGGTFTDAGVPAVLARLHHIRDMAAAPDGSVYVADGPGRRVVRITPQGDLVVVVGDGMPGDQGDGGSGTRARLITPSALAVRPDGGVYIVDEGAARVRLLTPFGNIEAAVGGGSDPSPGANALAANFSADAIRAVAVMPDGRLAIATATRILRVEPDGALVHLAGNATRPFSATGPAMNASVSPTSLVATPQSTLVYASGGNIVELATNGTLSPYAPTNATTSGRLAVGSDGTLYASQPGGVGSLARDGHRSTIIGPGAGAPKPLRALDLASASGAIAAAGDGTLYVALPAARQVVKVSTDGTPSVFAGTGVNGYSGDGGPATRAELGTPSDVLVGPDGSVYVADSGHASVRRIDPSGTISTVAGTGIADPDAFSPWSRANEAPIPTPLELAWTPTGELSILSQWSGKGRSTSIGVWPNPRAIGWVHANGTLQAIDPDASLDPRKHAYAANGDLVVLGFGSIRQCGGLGQIDLTRSLERIDTRFYDGTYTWLEREGHCPHDVMLARDGGVYYPADTNSYISVMGGLIHSLDGTSFTILAPAPKTDGRWFASLVDHPGGIGIIEQGHSGSRILLLEAPLASFGPVAHVVPSQDGRIAYGFDHDGRHLLTVDAITSVVLWRFAYGEDGRLLSATDRYDQTTTLVRSADTSQSTAVTIAQPHARNATVELDAEGRATGVVDERGERWTLGYTDGRLATFATPTEGVSTFTYGEDGRLVSDAGSDGGAITFTRRETATALEVTSNTSSGHRTTILLERTANQDVRIVTTDPSGLMSETRNVTGIGPTQVRDATGLRATATWTDDPRWGASARYVASMTLTSPKGVAATTTTIRDATVTSPAAPLSLLTYSVTVTSGGATTRTSYLPAERTIRTESSLDGTTVAKLDENGDVVELVEPGSPVMRYSYDEEGRMIRATESAETGSRERTWSYDDDARTVTGTDPLGRVSRLHLDAAGNVLRADLPGERAVAARYDAAGRLVALTTPGGGEHTFRHTPGGLIREAIAPGGTATTYAFTPEKELLGAKVEGGRSESRTYDAAGRLTAINSSEGILQLAYDDAGRLLRFSGDDRVAVSFDHDGESVVRETWIGEVQGSIEFSRDANGITGYRISDGPLVRLGYDEGRRLAAIGPVTLGYDGPGDRVADVRVGGTVETRTYDGFGELAALRTALGDRTLLSTTYERDALGRIVVKTETVLDETRAYAYSYDDAGRLWAVTVDGVSTEEYSYDANGNRVRSKSPLGETSYEHDAADRMLRAGDARFEHAPSGEVVAKTTPSGTTRYSYSRGTLQTVVLPDGSKVEYDLDAYGRRVGDGRGNGYLYDGALRPVAQVDSGNAVVATFVYATHENIPEAMVKDGRTYRIVTDHLGSVRLVVDSQTGAVAQRLDYDAYGLVTQDTAPGFQPFGFAGGLYDARTGLVRFGHRDYDGAMGRWVSPDPIGFEGGDTNLYKYARNEPINHVDRDGLQSSVTTDAGGGKQRGSGTSVGETTESGGAVGGVSGSGNSAEGSITYTRPLIDLGGPKIRGSAGGSVSICGDELSASAKLTLNLRWKLGSVKGRVGVAEVGIGPKITINPDGSVTVGPGVTVGATF